MNNELLNKLIGQVRNLEDRVYEEDYAGGSAAYLREFKVIDLIREALTAAPQPQALGVPPAADELLSELEALRESIGLFEFGEKDFSKSYLPKYLRGYAVAACNAVPTLLARVRQAEAAATSPSPAPLGGGPAELLEIEGWRSPDEKPEAMLINSRETGFSVDVLAYMGHGEFAVAYYDFHAGKDDWYTYASAEYSITIEAWQPLPERPAAPTQPKEGGAND